LEEGSSVNDFFENIFGSGLLGIQKMTEKGTPNSIFSSVRIIVAKIFDIHKKVIKFEKTISIILTGSVF